MRNNSNRDSDLDLGNRQAKMVLKKLGIPCFEGSSGRLLELRDLSRGLKTY